MMLLETQEESTKHKHSDSFGVKILLNIVMLATSASVYANAIAEQDQTWDVSRVVAVVQDRVLDSDVPEWMLFVGVTNKSDSARLVCMHAWDYAFHHDEQPRMRGHAGAHFCTVVQNFTLVLPGDTLFLKVPVGQVEERLESVTLVVDIHLSESRFAARRGLREFKLTWTGTVREALAAAEDMVN